MIFQWPAGGGGSTNMPDARDVRSGVEYGDTSVGTLDLNPIEISISAAEADTVNIEVETDPEITITVED